MLVAEAMVPSLRDSSTASLQDWIEVVRMNSHPPAVHPSDDKGIFRTVRRPSCDWDRLRWMPDVAQEV